MANSLNKKNNNSEILFQKAKNSKDYYRYILENIDDLISIYNEDLNCDYINEDALKRILGYKFEDIEGDKSFKIMHPNDLEKAKGNFYTSFKKGEAFGESRMKCKDGSYKWLQNRGKLFTKDGEKKLIIISRDITDLKKKNSKLKTN